MDISYIGEGAGTEPAAYVARPVSFSKEGDLGRFVYEFVICIYWFIYFFQTGSHVAQAGFKLCRANDDFNF